ncbi:Coiled-coil protein [Giardia muris]|uniref:Coiled-coil protein n=1 Tax=Giardia muris TaxID=5742 RepID=A0A4Z1T9A2_GIAMU|nr:Coiled-coil protein [Giardia muris]|eukprot:TNJ29727.1 Coiled-coil protein [Giardia muris]
MAVAPLLVRLPLATISDDILEPTWAFSYEEAGLGDLGELVGFRASVREALQRPDMELLASVGLLEEYVNQLRLLSACPFNSLETLETSLPQTTAWTVNAQLFHTSRPVDELVMALYACVAVDMLQVTLPSTTPDAAIQILQEAKLYIDEASGLASKVIPAETLAGLGLWITGTICEIKGTTFLADNGSWVLSSVELQDALKNLLRASKCYSEAIAGLALCPGIFGELDSMMLAKPLILTAYARMAGARCLLRQGDTEKCLAECHDVMTLLSQVTPVGDYSSSLYIADHAKSKISDEILKLTSEASAAAQMNVSTVRLSIPGEASLIPEAIEPIALFEPPPPLPNVIDLATLSNLEEAERRGNQLTQRVGELEELLAQREFELEECREALYMACQTQEETHAVQEPTPSVDYGFLIAQKDAEIGRLQDLLIRGVPPLVFPPLHESISKRDSEHRVQMESGFFDPDKLPMSPDSSEVAQLEEEIRNKDIRISELENIVLRSLECAPASDELQLQAAEMRAKISELEATLSAQSVGIPDNFQEELQRLRASEAESHRMLDVLRQEVMTLGQTLASRPISSQMIEQDLGSKTSKPVVSPEELNELESRVLALETQLSITQMDLQNANQTVAELYANALQTEDKLDFMEAALQTSAIHLHSTEDLLATTSEIGEAVVEATENKQEPRILPIKEDIVPMFANTLAEMGDMHLMDSSDKMYSDLLELVAALELENERLRELVPQPVSNMEACPLAVESLIGRQNEENADENTDETLGTSMLMSIGAEIALSTPWTPLQSLGTQLRAAYTSLENICNELMAVPLAPTEGKFVGSSDEEDDDNLNITDLSDLSAPLEDSDPMTRDLQKLGAHVLLLLKHALLLDTVVLSEIPDDEVLDRLKDGLSKPIPDGQAAQELLIKAANMRVCLPMSQDVALIGANLGSAVCTRLQELQKLADAKNTELAVITRCLSECALLLDGLRAQGLLGASKKDTEDAVTTLLEKDEEIQKLQFQHEHYERRIADLNRDITELQTELKERRTPEPQCSDEKFYELLAARDNEIRDLKDVLSALSNPQELSVFAPVIATSTMPTDMEHDCETRIRALEYACAEKSAEIVAVNEMLTIATHTNEMLNQQVTDSEQTLIRQRDTLSTLQHERDTLLASRPPPDQLAELQHLREMNCDLNQKLVAAESEHQRLQNIVIQLTEEKLIPSKIMSSLQDTSVSAPSTLSYEVHDLREKLAARDQEIQRLNHEVDSLRKQLMEKFEIPPPLETKIDIPPGMLENEVIGNLVNGIRMQESSFTHLRSLLKDKSAEVIRLKTALEHQENTVRSLLNAASIRQSIDEQADTLGVPNMPIDSRGTPEYLALEDKLKAVQRDLTQKTTEYGTLVRERDSFQEKLTTTQRRLSEVEQILRQKEEVISQYKAQLGETKMRPARDVIGDSYTPEQLHDQITSLNDQLAAKDRELTDYRWHAVSE